MASKLAPFLQLTQAAAQRGVHVGIPGLVAGPVEAVELDMRSGALQRQARGVDADHLCAPPASAATEKPPV